MIDPKLEEPDYASEVRFGVVMYGGVSLAIYINGVANEMYEMACSTPRPGGACEPANASNQPMTSREVYRRLSWLVGNPALCKSYASAIEAEKKRVREPGAAPSDVWSDATTVGAARTRLVVDVIAGTSAGGINGIFLAKALANGEAFGSLKDMWVNEGDIGLLLNDKRSYEGLEPPVADRSDSPASLLNSDRMYLKLLQAMRSMPPVAALKRSDGESPLVEEIDLFVTTTDIVGAPVPLRLADKVVYERRHKQNYRFAYPQGTGGGNDFAPANNAFLAFAARCTSSFPFAFEPMTLQTLERLKAVGGQKDAIRQWDHFFTGLPKKLVARGGHLGRAFGDGGYLDNKPFTYVVEALSQRQAGVPLERKLVYVEPSPQHLDPDEGVEATQVPDALSNALAALTSIPQYETIREDLQSVLRRNQRIERVENLVRLGERAIEDQQEPFIGVHTEGGQISPWSTLKLSQLVEFYGVAFLPYSRLRVFSLTDHLAEGLAGLWGIDRDSDHLYALRALVRFWRETQFADEAGPADDKQTITAFLDQFDVEHRLRRMRFLQRRIDQATRVLRLRRRGPLVEGAGLSTHSDAERQILNALKRHAYSLFDANLQDDSIERALSALRVLKSGLISTRAALQRQLREDREAHLVAHPQSETKRGQLIAVLELLLGERDPSMPPLRLPTVNGGEVPVKLGEEWVKASSASRTLQESVVLRVRALFEAAGGTSKTQLHADLESTIEAMRLKRNPRLPDAPQPRANAISARAWRLLGKPQLQNVQGVVAVAVDDVQAAPVDAEPLCSDDEAQALNNVEGRLLRRMLADYYLRFDSFDQMSFPLYYDTGTGEPSTVEVIRVSPEDAPALINERNDSRHRRKLAGTALFNFGAFLDIRWRRNDIMWGRLDGAERLIKALLPMSDEDTRIVRDELVARAQGSILREALVGEGQGDITALMCQALATMPGETTQERLNELLDQLRLGDPVQQSRLSSMLMSLLGEQGLLDFVRTNHQVDRSVEPKGALSNAARAVTITGRVLEGITKRRGNDTAVPRWLARVGLAMQGLVAVSLPGTLKHRLWTHGVKLLYAFEVLLLLMAMLFGANESRTLALIALGVTAAVHLLSLITGDLMRSRAKWWRLAAGVLGLGLVAAALLGGLALYNGSWRAVITASAGEQH